MSAGLGVLGAYGRVGDRYLLAIAICFVIMIVGVFALAIMTMPAPQDIHATLQRACEARWPNREVIYTDYQCSIKVDGEWFPERNVKVQINK